MCAPRVAPGVTALGASPQSARGSGSPCACLMPGAWAAQVCVRDAAVGAPGRTARARLPACSGSLFAWTNSALLRRVSPGGLAVAEPLRVRWGRQECLTGDLPWAELTTPMQARRPEACCQPACGVRARGPAPDAGALHARLAGFRHLPA
jgi:hypothetical protein